MRPKVIYRRVMLWLLAAMPIIMTLCSCETLSSITPHISIGNVQADCVLADELQRTETVTPLPEDHPIGLGEQWQLLKSHLVEEKGIADRSNDKTAFVNKNCRGAANGAVK